MNVLKQKESRLYPRSSTAPPSPRKTQRSPRIKNIAKAKKGPHFAAPVSVNQFKLTCSYLPVPDRGTCCGLLPALSVIVTSPVRVPTWVGVKLTLITQDLPTNTLVPAWHDFATVDRLKSPLTATLPITSVAVPVFFTVTVFGPFVTPTATLAHTSEVGVKVTTGPLLLEVTVRLTVVVAVKLPDVPVIVTVEVPVVAVALAASVNVLVVVAGFGLNVPVTPEGRPEAARVTLLLNPPTGVIVIVLFPLAP